MNHGAVQKTVAKAETAVLSSATHSLEIDTLGFEYASIDLVFSPFTSAAATAATRIRFNMCVSLMGKTDKPADDKGHRPESTTRFDGGAPRA